MRCIYNHNFILYINLDNNDMMNHIKILLIYKSVIECTIHKLLFNEFEYIICDCEMNMENVSKLDFILYDIIIYDVELLEAPTFLQENRHPIFVAKHHAPSEEIIHKFIGMGFDMFVIPPLNREDIEHMLMVYSLIDKYKDRPDE